MSGSVSSNTPLRLPAATAQQTRTRHNGGRPQHTAFYRDGVLEHEGLQWPQPSDPPHDWLTPFLETAAAPQTTHTRYGWGGTFVIPVEPGAFRAIPRPADPHRASTVDPAPAWMMEQSLQPQWAVGLYDKIEIAKSTTPSLLLVELPVDAEIDILDCLNNMELAAIRRVCRNTRTLANQPLVWTNREVTVQDKPAHGFYYCNETKWLLSLPLTTLRIQKNRWKTGETCRMRNFELELTRIPTLKTVVVEHPISFFVSCFGGWETKLKNVEFKIEGMVESDTQVHLKVIQQPKLRLSIEHLYMKLHEPGVYDLITRVPLPKLTKLTLAANIDTEPVGFRDWLTGCTNVTRCHLIADPRGRYNCLGDLNCLSSLHMLQITPVFIPQLAQIDFDCQFGNLTTLILTDENLMYRITPPFLTMAMFYDAVNRCTQLKTMVLKHTRGSMISCLECEAEGRILRNPELEVHFDALTDDWECIEEQFQHTKRLRLTFAHSSDTLRMPVSRLMHTWTLSCNIIKRKFPSLEELHIDSPEDKVTIHLIALLKEKIKLVYNGLEVKLVGKLTEFTLLGEPEPKSAAKTAASQSIEATIKKSLTEGGISVLGASTADSNRFVSEATDFLLAGATRA